MRRQADGPRYCLTQLRVALPLEVVHAELSQSRRQPAGATVVRRAAAEHRDGLVSLILRQRWKGDPDEAPVVGDHQAWLRLVGTARAVVGTRLPLTAARR